MKDKAGAGNWGYSYIRYSSDPQEEGDSIRRQTALSEAWFKKHPDVRLDKSLVLEDRGVSGLDGRHRTDPRNAMTGFLSHVDSGRVSPGSYLVVENLDRLTREAPLDSIPWIFALIKKGIRIVQLSPTELVYDAGMDQGKLMMMLWELSRGHGESRRKSELLGQAWAEKKLAARSGVPYGRAVPAWLMLVDNRYRLKPGAERTIRVIFALSAKGYGLNRIVKELEGTGHKPFSGGDHWSRSAVYDLLTNRAVMGEYQPHKGRSPRVPDGEPIPNYFTAALTEAEFFAGHNATKSRVRRSGRPRKKGGPTSPFAGLLFNALDGQKLRATTSHGRLVLRSVARVEGHQGGAAGQFTLSHLVEGLLVQLAELSAAALFADPGAARVEELKAKLSDTEKRLSVATSRFAADPESLAWQEQVTLADRDRRDLLAQLREAQQAAANPVSSTWTEAVQRMKEEEPERLRQCLLSTVQGVWCVFVPRGELTLAAVQVWFVGEQVRRDYLLVSRIPIGAAVRKRKRACLSFSLADRLPCDFDFRDRASAQELADLLAELDVSELF